MDERICKCGCDEPMTGANNWEYKRGHKPKGKKLYAGARLARREKPIVIDAEIEAEAEPEFVECLVSVPQLDAIYALLQPRQKALAVLNALNEEA